MVPIVPGEVPAGAEVPEVLKCPFPAEGPVEFESPGAPAEFPPKCPFARSAVFKYGAGPPGKAGRVEANPRLPDRPRAPSAETP